MRVIIAGSRDITDYAVVSNAVLESDFEVTTVISGGARGVDKLGERYAETHQLPVDVFLADWHIHGRSAGYIRNEQMARSADALVAVWDGESKGTGHMIDIAKKQGLEVYIAYI